MKKYFIGDKVRVVSKKKNESQWDEDGKMDKYLGTVVTIKYVVDDHGIRSYVIEEDQGTRDGAGWMWFNHMFEDVVESAEPCDTTTLSTKEYIALLPDKHPVKIMSTLTEMLGHALGRDEDDEDEAPKVVIDESKPHLIHTECKEFLGYIGAPTAVTDENGDPFCVGDRVDLQFPNNGMTVESIICCDRDTPEGFVMGVAVINFKQGKGADPEGAIWTITKTEGFDTLEHGYAHVKVRAVKNS